MFTQYLPALETGLLFGFVVSESKVKDKEERAGADTAPVSSLWNRQCVLAAVCLLSAKGGSFSRAGNSCFQCRGNI